MDYQFREIRKGERDPVVGFAQTQGCAIRPDQLRHHLSLTVKSGGEMLAAALCLEVHPGQFVIEIASPQGGDEALVAELADRCLRKVQSEAIASVRLQSPSEDSAQTIWKQANWLDQVEESPPPADPHHPSPDGETASQAA